VAWHKIKRNVRVFRIAFLNLTFASRKKRTRLRMTQKNKKKMSRKILLQMND
jgi:hypothetical protein